MTEKKDVSNPEGAKKGGRVNIKMADGDAKGAYSNLSIIHNNEFEFVMDFVFMEPGRHQGQLVSRVVTNPRAAKRMLKGLGELVRRYEERFGEISMPDEQSPKGEYH